MGDSGFSKTFGVSTVSPQSPLDPWTYKVLIDSAKECPLSCWWGPCGAVWDTFHVLLLLWLIQDLVFGMPCADLACWLLSLPAGKHRPFRVRSFRRKFSWQISTPVAFQSALLFPYAACSLADLHLTKSKFWTDFKVFCRDVMLMRACG